MSVAVILFSVMISSQNVAEPAVPAEEWVVSGYSITESYDIDPLDYIDADASPLSVQFAFADDSPEAEWSVLFAGGKRIAVVSATDAVIHSMPFNIQSTVFSQNGRYALATEKLDHESYTDFLTNPIGSCIMVDLESGEQMVFDPENDGEKVYNYLISNDGDILAFPPYTSNKSTFYHYDWMNPVPTEGANIGGSLVYQSYSEEAGILVGTGCGGVVAVNVHGDLLWKHLLHEDTSLNLGTILSRDGSVVGVGTWNSGVILIDGLTGESIAATDSFSRVFSFEFTDGGEECVLSEMENSDSGCDITKTYSINRADMSADLCRVDDISGLIFVIDNGYYLWLGSRYDRENMANSVVWLELRDQEYNMIWKSREYADPGAGLNYWTVNNYLELDYGRSYMPFGMITTPESVIVYCFFEDQMRVRIIEGV